MEDSVYIREGEKELIIKGSRRSRPTFLNSSFRHTQESRLSITGEERGSPNVLIRGQDVHVHGAISRLAVMNSLLPSPRPSELRPGSRFGAIPHHVLAQAAEKRLYMHAGDHAKSSIYAWVARICVPFSRTDSSHSHSTCRETYGSKSDI